MAEPKKDANDTLRDGGTPAVEAQRAAARPYNGARPVPLLSSLVRGAKALQHKIFPPLRWLVPRYATEGVTILAGRPKIGKSWLALGAAIAVAEGGECLGEQCEQGDVLGLFLEDNDRRLQSRMTRLIGANKDEWPERLTYATEWPRLGEGGLQLISQWIREAEKPRLVVVDILQKVRDLPRKEHTQYSTDYDALTALQKIAGDFRLSVLVNHHQRKAAADDPLDTVSGTLGLTGAADSALILEARAAGKVLSGRGRDLPEYEVAVKKSEEGWWQVIGDAAAAESDQRRLVIEYLKENKEIDAERCSVLLNNSKHSASKLLAAMAGRGALGRRGRGTYVLHEGSGIGADELPF